MTTRTKLVLLAMLTALAMPADARQNVVNNLCPPGVCVGTADQRPTQIWAGGRAILEITPGLVKPVGTVALGTTEFPFTLPIGQGLPAGCSDGQLAVKSGSTWICGTVEPGGDDTQVQFNDGGTFGGVAGLVFNKVTNALTVLGAFVSTTVNTGQGATEVHLMDQNLRTTDSPTFVAVNVTGGEMVLTGTGHPQGVQAGAVGRLYRDTVTGVLYKKLGGGSTAYGWYRDITLGAAFPNGPTAWQITPSSDNAASSGQASGFGWMHGVGGTTYTQTSVTTAAMTYSNGRVFKSITSAATQNTVMYVVHPQPTVMRYWEQDFDCVWSIKTGASVAASRWWVLFSTGVQTDSDDNTGQAVGFRYSTGVPDGGWVGYTRDATTPSVTATVAAITADTEYLMRVRLVRSGTPTAYFSINDGTEISKTSNIPATGVTSFPSWGVTTEENVAKTFHWRSAGCVFGS